MTFDISRRNFLKGAVGSAGIIAAGTVAAPLALTGCSSEGSSTEKSSASLTPGTYEGVGTGKQGEIKVSVTVSESSIDSIEVVSQSETPVMSENALEILPLKIVATQNLSVDSVSGATLTSMGLIAAVTAAVEAAGGSASDFSGDESALDQITQSMTPGTYSGFAQGCWAPNSIEGQRFGAAEVPELIQVDVTVDETSITNVEVVSCTDTPQFVAPAVERIPAAILDQQSVLVDAVTGATRTSAGILRATALALKDAGADLTGFAKSTERVTDSEEYDCDVCIVGGGHAGTTAAAVAAEAGLSVVVLEKAGRVGGKGFCSGGISAVGSKLQTDAGIKLTADDLYQTFYEESGGRANCLILRTISNECGKTVDWLVDHDFPVEASDPNAPLVSLQYVCSLPKGQEKFDGLYNNSILNNGGTVLTETKAESLIMADGKVSGVTATKQNGTTVKVNCGAVIVSTGGFGGSNPMLDRFFHSHNFYDRGLTTTCSGDGLSMCENIGAQLGPEIMPHMQEYGANMVCDFTANLIKYTTYAGLLQVNPNGERFMDESLVATDAMGYGCAALRVHGYYYLIMDQTMVDDLIKGGILGLKDGAVAEALLLSDTARSVVPLTTLQDDLDNAIEYGQAWKADSPEALAEAIGFANPQVFVDTFNRYNEICESGTDTDFGKDSRLLTPNTGTLYAIHMNIPIMGTLGGVKVNEKLEALDTAESPIPGLYVAGQEASGFYSYPYYTVKCATSTWAYTSGRLAAQNAAEYLGK